MGHITFDREHNLLYNAGRGERVVTVFAYNPETPQSPLIPLVDFQGAAPQKGYSQLPKWALSVTNHEIGRGVRLTNAQTIEYVSYNQPNRAGNF